MSDPASIRRQLKIKAGAVKRLAKERDSYRKEIDQLRLSLKKLIAEDSSEDRDWKIKNGTNLVNEAEKMIKDSADRLEKAQGELEDLVVGATKISELAEDGELLGAKVVLRETKANT